MKIAISGKGGVGKTPIASLLIQSFAQTGRMVTAIDADPDANLAHALGFPASAQPTPLADLKELIGERVGAEPGKPTVYFRMNPKVDDIPEKYSVVKGNIRLMAMGTVRRGGSGCACPEHVLLRGLLSHLLVERDEVVVMDMEAGIEHLGRGTAQFVDILLVIVQTAATSIQTYGRIKTLAADLGIRNIGVIANRISAESDIARIRTETGAEPVGAVPAHPGLEDYHGSAPDESVKNAIAQIVEKLKNSG